MTPFSFIVWKTSLWGGAITKWKVKLPGTNRHQHLITPGETVLRCSKWIMFPSRYFDVSCTKPLHTKALAYISRIPVLRGWFFCGLVGNIKIPICLTSPNCVCDSVCVCLGSIYLLFNLWFLASRKNNPTVHEPSGKQGWQCKIFILQPFVSFLPVCRSYFSEYRIIVIYIYTYYYCYSCI